MCKEGTVHDAGYPVTPMSSCEALATPPPSRHRMHAMISPPGAIGSTYAHAAWPTFTTALTTPDGSLAGGLHKLRWQSLAAADPDVPPFPEPHRPRPSRTRARTLGNVSMRPLCSRCMLQGVARLPVRIKQLAGVPVRVVVFVAVVDLAKCPRCPECVSHCE